MDVSIKSFDVKMDVKSKGIEFEVRKPKGGAHRGDCLLTMTGVTWCEGRTKPENGVKISWDDLAVVLADVASRKAAVKAAKAAQS